MKDGVNKDRRHTKSQTMFCRFLWRGALSGENLAEITYNSGRRMVDSVEMLQYMRGHELTCWKIMC